MPYQDITAALGLQGWVVAFMDFHAGELRLHIERTGGLHRCRRCGTQTAQAYDHGVRPLRDLPISGRPVYLYTTQWRVECHLCRAVVTEQLDLCEEGQSMTRRYEQYLARLCELLPTQTVAALEGLSWGAVARVDRKHLQRRHQAQRLAAVTQSAKIAPKPP
jgi:transposase